jgi:hypothetical protein
MKYFWHQSGRELFLNSLFPMIPRLCRAGIRQRLVNNLSFSTSNSFKARLDNATSSWFKPRKIALGVFKVIRPETLSQICDDMQFIFSSPTSSSQYIFLQLTLGDLHWYVVVYDSLPSLKHNR